MAAVAASFVNPSDIQKDESSTWAAWVMLQQRSQGLGPACCPQILHLCSLFGWPVVSEVKALCIKWAHVFTRSYSRLVHFLQCLGVCWIYYHGSYFHMSGGQWRWICVHMMYQREIFAAVVVYMQKKLVLLFKQSFSDSQARREDSEKDAGSDAKLVVSFNSFCRASFCWLESLHLKCNYSDVEKKTGKAQPYQKRGNFLTLPLHHQQWHILEDFQIQGESLGLDTCVKSKLHISTDFNRALL